MADGKKEKEMKASRRNKIYHTPPTPPPEVQRKKEKAFILDSVAASSISIDYSKVNPKLGPVVPPYNSQNDELCGDYFEFAGVHRTLKKTRQDRGGCSIEGPVMDYFFTDGAGYKYLKPRNKHGAGHSEETVDGHAQFLGNIKPMDGYNGKYGYRRNTPWLRLQTSPFGTSSRSPTH